MIEIKALSYFRGKEKYNCAQAILKTFQDDYSVSQDLIDSYKKKGFGKVEGNICGALYALKELLQSEEQFEMAQNRFAEEAGSPRCKEIRKKKYATCKDCVAIAARIMHDLKDNRAND